MGIISHLFYLDFEVEQDKQWTLEKEREKELEMFKPQPVRPDSQWQ